MKHGREPFGFDDLLLPWSEGLHSKKQNAYIFLNITFKNEKQTSFQKLNLLLIGNAFKWFKIQNILKGEQ